jgi:hypothetical protein
VEEQRVQLTVRELMELRSWLTKIQEVLGTHENDLKDIFIRLDQTLNRMEAMNLALQDARRDTQDLKALAIEQRQATRNLWYGVILAVVTALIGKFITIAK